MRSRGFTLIELLVVVAIIAILAAIAVPNLLEAQMRSKVSRAKADMSTMATALNAYVVDANHYPLPVDGIFDAVSGLTTPLAYLSSLPRSPFNKATNWGPDAIALGSAPFPDGQITYMDYGWYYFEVRGATTGTRSWADRAGIAAVYSRRGGMLKAFGPDGLTSVGEWWAINHQLNPRGLDSIYDPTNGTVSNGDIMRLVGDVDAEAAARL